MAQFSLRTFLVVVLAAGIGLGWLEKALKRVPDQRQIVAQITAAGGRVYYDYQIASHPPAAERV